jgi:topoisomerase-4 subunit A
LDRIHILEGRMIVFLNIDEVIRIIRESDEPKPALIKALGSPTGRPKTSSKSACASWRGWKRSRSSRNCGTAQREGQARRTAGSDPAMKRLLIKEIEADAKQYGDERRTLIQQEKRATFEPAWSTSR